MSKPILNHALRVGFQECIEQDFFIQTFGYNDFHFIDPKKTPRIQHMYTLHLVLNGSGTLFLGGKSYHLKRHDMFFIPPGVTLCYYPDKGDEWSYIWFEFTGQNSEKYASLLNMSAENPVKKCNDFSNFYYYIHSILKKLENQGSLGYYEIFSAFCKLLDANTQTNSQDAENFAETVMSYIRCHYHDAGLSVNDICKDLKLSHSYMCKLFKTNTGTSPVRYLVEYRIKKAAELLKSTNLTVKEISYSVGFNDCLHFMKTFKKQMGTSAGEYRKQALLKEEAEV